MLRPALAACLLVATAGFAPPAWRPLAEPRRVVASALREPARDSNDGLGEGSVRARPTTNARNAFVAGLGIALSLVVADPSLAAAPSVSVDGLASSLIDKASEASAGAGKSIGGGLEVVGKDLQAKADAATAKAAADLKTKADAAAGLVTDSASTKRIFAAGDKFQRQYERTQRDAAAATGSLQKALESAGKINDQIADFGAALGSGDITKQASKATLEAYNAGVSKVAANDKTKKIVAAGGNLQRTVEQTAQGAAAINGQIADLGASLVQK